MKYILVTGSQHSGTSLLCATLGGHKKISMLAENTKYAIKDIVGTEYAGNKLIYGIQIRMDFRAGRITHLVNRILRTILPTYTNVYRLFPNSQMSFKDYLDMGAKVIVMERDKEANIESILRREKVSRATAEKHIDNLNDVKQLPGVYKVNLKEFTSNTEETLKGICNFLEIEYDDAMLTAIQHGYKWGKEYGSKIEQKV